MRLQACFTRVLVPALLAGGVAFAQTPSAKLPDTQVQSNVLRSIAASPELATQQISASTISGTVTLSGSVQSDAQRRRADQIASVTPGVQRVVDELTVTDQGNQIASVQAEPGSDGRVLQSDGTYAPADAATQTTQPAAQIQQNGSFAQPGASNADDVPPPNGPDTDPYGRPLNAPQGQPATPSSTPYGQPSYSQQPYGQPPRGAYNSPYNQPPQQGYNQPYAYGQQMGQPGGQTVTLPPGTVLRVRVNQHLSSRDVGVGTAFDAMVVNDVIADRQVAIPRGTFVQGTVVEEQRAGHLTGRGELGLRLNQLTLGGQAYPLVSDTFSAHGGDKTIQTVNSTAGLGALGAIFGAVAGGGVGAAIGAGVGGAAGLGASAASGRGDVFIPSEAVLTFRITQPISVTTVSQAEMQRLAYGVPAGEGRGPQIVRRAPYPYYGGPVFYPRYYRPYGYYRY